MQIFDAVLDLVSCRSSSTTFHVADRNVCVGAFSGLHDLHREIHVPDPAADQGGIEDHGFHEAIRSSEHLVFSAPETPRAG